MTRLAPRAFRASDLPHWFWLALATLGALMLIPVGLALYWRYLLFVFATTGTLERILPEVV